MLLFCCPVGREFLTYSGPRLTVLIRHRTAEYRTITICGPECKKMRRNRWRMVLNNDSSTSGGSPRVNIITFRYLVPLLAMLNYYVASGLLQNSPETWFEQRNTSHSCPMHCRVLSRHLLGGGKLPPPPKPRNFPPPKNFWPALIS